MASAMNQIPEGTHFKIEEASDAAPAVGRSSSPTRIKIVLPVWGSRFVRQFLEFALPTLLAPGNVPALAKALPCEFVLLTSGQDVPSVRQDTGWRRLRQICRTDFELIDDLITEGNHTTTLTLAYARAIKQAGEQMVNTCFFLLVSDYILADGSLGHVLERMQNGMSGVLAGNFQIIAEDAIPMIRRKLSSISPELILPPRSLMQWTFNHLHPTTSASIVNYPLNHKSHTNRLFWRVDGETFIGRFYLLHPIAVRPEVTDFVIGSSFDYSFIPEMCPSGRVEAVTDSDEYLVVEMQPRAHEADQVRWGPLQPGSLAKSLSEWTTVQHRRNVQYTFVYHASDIPEGLEATKEQAEQFVADVNRHLTPAAQPYRHHHYWSGAVAAHQIRTGQELNAEQWQYLIGGLAGDRRRDKFAFYGRVALFGAWPDVRPWHPRWPDCRPVLRELKRAVRPDAALLVLGRDPIHFAPWLASTSYRVTARETARLMNLPRDQYALLVGRFDGCLIFLPEGDLKSTDELFKRLAPLMKPGGQVLISISNDQPEDLGIFADSFAYHSGCFANLALWVTDVQFVPTSWLRRKSRRLLAHLGGYARNCPIQMLPLVTLATAGVTILNCVCNLLAWKTTSEPSNRLYSSVFMVFRRAADGPAIPLPDFDDGSIEKRFAAMADQQPTGEIVSHNCVEVARHNSVEAARYSFAKSLVGNREDVGQYGYDEGPGMELFLGEIKKLTVYDCDPEIVDDLQSRSRGQLGWDAQAHDVLCNPLPTRHDTIFCLRALERIKPEDEDQFVRNLKDSLSIGGSLIMGSQTPPAFERGLVFEATRAHTRSGTMIKALMERHFDEVSFFAMIGSSVFAGDVPGAQYFLALCRSKDEKVAAVGHSHDVDAT